MNKNWWIASLLAVLVVAAGVYLFSIRGYGTVSRDAYECVKALYGACLAKSDDRVSKVQAIIKHHSQDEPAVSHITDRERGWIQNIIHLAQQGHWDSAAQRARRMMEDQVRY